MLVGIGAFFVFVRPPLLPEDLRFLGRSGGEIDQFVAAAAKLVAARLHGPGRPRPHGRRLTIFVAATGVREGHIAAVVALAIAGATSIGLMAVVNFAIRSDFRWALLGATGLWVPATAAAVWF